METIFAVVWIIWIIAVLILYHKVFAVYYFDLGNGLLKELIVAAIVAGILTVLTFYYWWVVAIIIVIFGFINMVRTGSKAPIVLAVILAGALSVMGQTVLKDIRPEEQKQTTNGTSGSRQNQSQSADNCQHEWVKESCLIPEKCKFCNTYKENVSGHEYNAGICEFCFEYDMDYAELQFNTEVMEVACGESIPLDFTCKTYNTDIPINFYSSNGNIATLDDNGNITGLSMGTCTIELIPPKGISAKGTINVVENLAKQCTLKYTALPLYVEGRYGGEQRPSTSGTVTNISYQFTNNVKDKTVNLHLTLSGYKNDGQYSDAGQPVRMHISLRNSAGAEVHAQNCSTTRLQIGENFSYDCSITLPPDNYELVISDFFREQR